MVSRYCIPLFQDFDSKSLFRHQSPKLPLSVWPLNPMVQGGKRKHTLGFPKTDVRTVCFLSPLEKIIGSGTLLTGVQPRLPRVYQPVSDSDRRSNVALI
mgnify:CR=1 FL=1